MTSTVSAPILSFLFTPSNHPRRVEKVFQVGAHAVILDLEDAVAISEKPQLGSAVNAFSSRPNSGTMSASTALIALIARKTLRRLLGHGCMALCCPKLNHAPV